VANLCAKFEVFSCNRSRDMEGSQNSLTHSLTHTHTQRLTHWQTHKLIS